MPRVGQSKDPGRAGAVAQPVASQPFAADSEGYKCFRIPQLVPTAKGILASAEAGFDHCGDAGDIDLVAEKRALGNLDERDGKWLSIGPGKAVKLPSGPYVVSGEYRRDVVANGVTQSYSGAVF
ncbi:sialidase family protein [Streptomyces antimicrobicus]|uniref:Glycoside hydrolase n=1 Tax=Streptomyces antimicrobicus TaxID=2883108 RepID=A0ABS8B060_9ACTN|nr:sialidase family protein [Streptomyces antimicrobicus]MCB5177993.1 glycoside hydrolase [Streptomyces antimicrobicus]